MRHARTSTPAGTPVVHSLWHAAALASRAASEALAPLGLSFTDHVALTAVANGDARMEAELRAPNVFFSLVLRGLLRERGSCAPLRIADLELTPLGATLLGEASSYLADLEARLNAGLIPVPDLAYDAVA